MAACAKAWRSAPANTLRGGGAWFIPGTLIGPLFLGMTKRGRIGIGGYCVSDLITGLGTSICYKREETKMRVRVLYHRIV